MYRLTKSPRSAKKFYAKLHKILCRWYWSWRVTADSTKIEGIKGNRPLRVGKIRRNRATILLAKLLSTSSRVRTGFNGLSCSRSGQSEKRPSLIHDSASFGWFFQIFSPHGANSPFQTVRAHIWDILVVTSYRQVRRKNRKNRRKSTPQGRKISPKSGDDRIDQVFSYVIAGSSGFQRVAVLRIGSVRKAAFHDSRRRIFWIFFHIFSPDGEASPFQTEASHTHTHKSGLIFVHID